VTMREALVAIDILRRNKEQNNGDIQPLKLLRRRDRELSSSQLSSKHQSQLHG
jgi:hypothetical protein